MKLIGSGTVTHIDKPHKQPCPGKNDPPSKDCTPHDYTSGCESVSWSYYSTNYCWATYACLGSGINTANAHIISPYELPDVGGYYPLSQNYYYTIVPTGSSGTPAGCEYACDG